MDTQFYGMDKVEQNMWKEELQVKTTMNFMITIKSYNRIIT